MMLLLLPGGEEGAPTCSSSASMGPVSSVMSDLSACRCQVDSRQTWRLPANAEGRAVWGNKDGGRDVEVLSYVAQNQSIEKTHEEHAMSQEPSSNPLSERDLDAVAGGSAIDQIQQAIDQAQSRKGPQNLNETLNVIPPNMSYPTSNPYGN
ncbi:MAG: hypothetical protein EB084_17785 [Proteobacteria bacterium]|nr:hypothetical protein [Pseudomonadota bacterium]